MREFRASSRRATFGFRLGEDGRIDLVAPYGWRWLLGRPLVEAVSELRQRGFDVQELKSPQSADLPCMPSDPAA